MESIEVAVIGAAGLATALSNSGRFAKVHRFQTTSQLRDGIAGLSSVRPEKLAFLFADNTPNDVPNLTVSELVGKLSQKGYRVAVLECSPLGRQIVSQHPGAGLIPSPISTNIVLGALSDRGMGMIEPVGDAWAYQTIDPTDPGAWEKARQDQPAQQTNPFVQPGLQPAPWEAAPTQTVAPTGWDTEPAAVNQTPPFQASNTTSWTADATTQPWGETPVGEWGGTAATAQAPTTPVSPEWPTAPTSAWGEIAPEAPTAQAWQAQPSPQPAWPTAPAAPQDATAVDAGWDTTSQVGWPEDTKPATSLAAQPNPTDSSWGAAPAASWPQAVTPSAATSPAAPWATPTDHTPWTGATNPAPTPWGSAEQASAPAATPWAAASSAPGASPWEASVPAQNPWETGQQSAGGSTPWASGPEAASPWATATPPAAAPWGGAPLAPWAGADPMMQTGNQQGSFDSGYTTPLTARKGFVISVCVSKGGAGKSSLTLNLGVWLAMKLRSMGRTVCIVDANWQQADIGKQINAYNPNIAGLSQHQEDLTVQRIGRHLYTRQDLNTSFLLGPARVEEANPLWINPQLYSRAVEQLRQVFDYVLVDSPVAEYHHELFTDFILPRSDFLLVPVLPNWPTIINTDGWLRAITTPKNQGGQGFDERRVGIVLNRAEADIGFDEQQVQQELGSWHFLGAIPDSKEWRRAANSDEIIATRNVPEINRSFAQILYAITQEDALLDDLNGGSDKRRGRKW